MIQFRCPGCQAAHKANPSFAGMTARCVKCGAPIRIPKGGAAGAKPRRQAVQGPMPTPPGPGDDPFDDIDLSVDPAGEAPAAEPPVPSEAEAETEYDAEPTDEPTDEPRSRVPLYVGGGLIGAAVVGVGLYFTVFSKEEPSQKPGVAAAAVAAATEAPAPTPAPAPPTPPPPPAPPPPPPPLALTAARLAAEYAAGAEACDARYKDRVLAVSGTLARPRPAALRVALTAPGVAADQDVECALVAPAEAQAAARRPLEAVVGPAAALPHEYPAPDYFSLRPGQPATVRGTYAAGHRLTGCVVVRTTCPADELYKGRTVEVTGLVGSAQVEDTESGFPTATFEAPTTTAVVTVAGLFRASERATVAALRPGRPATLRGVCGGRSGQTVRLDNCQVLAAPSGDPAAVRVDIAQFVREYEADLLAAPPADPTGPPVARVTPSELAAAFEADPAVAWATYGGKRVEVAGRVAERQSARRAAVFKGGTDQRYRVLAAFTPSRFQALPDSPAAVIRGVCVGVAGAFVRLESAEFHDPEADDPAVLRTTADYLPFAPGREVFYEQVQFGKPGENVARVVSWAFAADGEVRVRPLLVGGLRAASLFAPGAAPRWTADLRKKNVPYQTARYRVLDDRVECGTPSGPPAAPGAVVWEPVLKLGLKKGQTWSGDTPAGQPATYTVTDFRTDDRQRPVVDITRRAADKDKAVEEVVVTYARGVGEVRRVVTHRTPAGVTRTAFESRQIESVPEVRRPTDPPGKAPK